MSTVAGDGVGVGAGAFTGAAGVGAGASDVAAAGGTPIEVTGGASPSIGVDFVISDTVGEFTRLR
jgi:hypothetical protein